MYLRDLQNVITDDSVVFIVFKQGETPTFFSSWRECKETLSENTWNRKAELDMTYGIMITLCS